MKTKHWILGLLLLTVATFTIALDTKEDLSHQAANPLALAKSSAIRRWLRSADGR